MVDAIFPVASFTKLNLGCKAAIWATIGKTKSAIRKLNTTNGTGVFSFIPSN
jgi:hypothetical protein